MLSAVLVVVGFPFNRTNASFTHILPRHTERCSGIHRLYYACNNNMYVHAAQANVSGSSFLLKSSKAEWVLSLVRNDNENKKTLGNTSAHMYRWKTCGPSFGIGFQYTNLPVCRLFARPM